MNNLFAFPTNSRAIHFAITSFISRSSGPLLVIRKRGPTCWPDSKPEIATSSADVWQLYV
jgi:hypothetical protein